MIVANTLEYVTALSTLALALVTFALVLSTRRLAVEAGKETSANWRPVLVTETQRGRPGIPFPVAFDQRNGTLELVVRNVGRGPAMGITAYVEWPEDNPRRPLLSANVLAPDGTMTMRWSDFEQPTDDSPLGVGAWIAVHGKVTYGDVSYRRHETTFAIGFRSDGVAARLTEHVQAFPDLSTLSSFVLYRAAVWLNGRRARLRERRDPLPRRVQRGQ